MSKYTVLCVPPLCVIDTIKAEVECDSPGLALILGVVEIDGEFNDDFEPLCESITKGVWVTTDPDDNVWIVQE